MNYIYKHIDCQPMDVVIVLALSKPLTSIKHTYFEQFIDDLFTSISSVSI